MRVFFDASVIIASLLSPTGGSSQLFIYVKIGKIQGITSQSVVAEVLSKSIKLKKSKDELEAFIAKSGLIVRKVVTAEEIAPYVNFVETEDAHVVAGANLTKCTHLVTLDKKHLLKAEIKNKFTPLKILSPKEMLEEIILI